MKKNGREIEVIVKTVIPTEQLFERIKGDEGKRRIEKAIDMILEQTEKCPKVKIIFTNRA